MRGGWVALVLGVGLCAPALAQEVSQPLPQPSLILTLNKEGVYRDSMTGQAIEAGILAENEALAAENRKIDAALEAEERALTDQRPQLAASDFQALADAFNTKAVGLRDAQLAKAKALQRKRDEKRQEFFQALGPVLAEIMRQAGAFVILDDSAVLVSFDRIDVTLESIRRIDEYTAAAAP
jgi:Skp family chaperone for outer membrane proteins